VSEAEEEGGLNAQSRYVCKCLLALMQRATNNAQEETTRDRVLDAALQAFAEHGFDGATTKKIAARAKVNEVTLFRLFRSKRALFAAVVAERSPLARIRQEVSFDTNALLDDVIYQNIRTVLDVLRSNKHMLMVAVGGAWRYPKAREMVNTQIIQEGIKFVSGFIASQMDAGRLKKGDPKIAARALMGMVQAYFITIDLMGGMSIGPAEEEKTLRGFTSIFLDGMRAEGGDGSR